MKLAKRFFYYFGGFTIGVFLLYFFVGGSGASCEYDYGPNARTLKNIRGKNRVLSPEVIKHLNDHQLDSADISKLLRNGDVQFSRSNTKLDSCKIYVIEGLIKDKELSITVENCEKKATIQSLKVNP